VVRGLQPVLVVLDESAARAVAVDPGLRSALAELADQEAGVQVQLWTHVFDLADRLDRSLWRLLTATPGASVNDPARPSASTAASRRRGRVGATGG
jgi:hypothetical protein